MVRNQRLEVRAFGEAGVEDRVVGEERRRQSRRIASDRSAMVAASAANGSSTVQRAPNRGAARTRYVIHAATMTVSRSIVPPASRRSRIGLRMPLDDLPRAVGGDLVVAWRMAVFLRRAKLWSR